jgi:hypothetical protein
MTRRKFIGVLAKTGAVIVAGVLWVAKVPKRFVRALPVKRYPGSLRAMGDVSRGGKWSG